MKHLATMALALVFPSVVGAACGWNVDDLEAETRTALLEATKLPLLAPPYGEAAILFKRRASSHTKGEAPSPSSQVVHFRRVSPLQGSAPFALPDPEDLRVARIGGEWRGLEPIGLFLLSPPEGLPRSVVNFYFRKAFRSKAGFVVIGSHDGKLRLRCFSGLETDLED